MAKHGVYVTEQGSNVQNPVQAVSGIPFVVGVAPVTMAADPAKANIPIRCNNWGEAVEHFGYSDDWDTYTICEAMYAHFRLCGASPLVICSVIGETDTKTVPAAAKDVKEHKITLPITVVNGDGLVVSTAETANAENTLVKGSDYEVYYSTDDGACYIELLEDSASYAATSLFVAYKELNTTAVTADKINSGFEAVEQCITRLGVLPDLLVAPKWSSNSTVAAVMTAKAAAISGLFKGKTIVDIDCGTSGAKTYNEAITKKASDELTDANQIVCWPMVTADGKKFHMSSLLAGVMARVDTANGGVPYMSPSNNSMPVTGTCLADGTEVNLTLAAANELNCNGIMTALNFVSGWCAWGNYTGAFPGTSEPLDAFIPVGRMFQWVGNSIIQQFWNYLDRPMTRVLIDTILDSVNIWMGGLRGSGYLLGGRVEMLEDENPTANLMQGIIKLHVFVTPPSPAQEIDFVLEYDPKYVTEALLG